MPIKVKNSGNQSIPLMKNKGGNLEQVMIPAKTTVTFKDSEVTPLMRSQIKNVECLKEVI